MPICCVMFECFTQHSNSLFLVCFPGMTASLAIVNKPLSGAFFSKISYFLMFLNIQIDLLILKTYYGQFTLTTKKSLHTIFKGEPSINKTSTIKLDDTAYHYASPLSRTNHRANGHKFSAIRHLSWRVLNRSKSVIFTYSTCIWRPRWGDPSQISPRSLP